MKIDDPWEESVEPFAQLIYEHSHLTPQQSELLARAVLELVGEFDSHVA